MTRIDEVKATLSPQMRAQSDKLTARLDELHVSEGLQARLQGLSRFGSEHSMIWKYLADLQDPAIKRRVKNVGAYLWKCLANGPRWKSEDNA